MFYQSYLAMSNSKAVTGGKPIAVCLQSISGVKAINPLVAFYNIHGRKKDVLFFYFVPDTLRDILKSFGIHRPSVGGEIGASQSSLTATYF
jgi:hypothetical protein